LVINPFRQAFLWLHFHMHFAMVGTKRPPSSIASKS